jgi:hypothetical protein
MLPIVNKDVEGTRVSIYNQQTQAKFPPLGLKLKNTSGLHLMQGPITVFEGSNYAGDARSPDDEAVAQDNRRRLGLVQRSGNRLSSRMTQNIVTNTPAGLAVIPPETVAELARSGIVMCGPDNRSGLVTNLAALGAEPASWSAPTLDDLLSQEPATDGLTTNTVSTDEFGMVKGLVAVLVSEGGHHLRIRQCPVGVLTFQRADVSRLRGEDRGRSPSHPRGGATAQPRLSQSPLHHPEGGKKNNGSGEAYAGELNRDGTSRQIGSETRPPAR